MSNGEHAATKKSSFISVIRKLRVFAHFNALTALCASQPFAASPFQTSALTFRSFILSLKPISLTHK